MGCVCEWDRLIVRLLCAADKSTSLDGVATLYVSGGNGSEFSTCKTRACHFSFPENYFYVSEILSLTERYLVTEEKNKAKLG